MMTNAYQMKPITSRDLAEGLHVSRATLANWRRRKGTSRALFLPGVVVNQNAVIYPVEQLEAFAAANPTYHSRVKVFLLRVALASSLRNDTEGKVAA